MSNVWGNTLKLSLFGESHGPSIGIVVDGLPPGISFDLARVSQEMARRRPGTDPYSTTRREADAFEIQSGYFDGHTTGAPLCALIRNTNQHSRDYDAFSHLPRPSHADYTAYVKYKGQNDRRGGGHFSGRLTAPLVFAGALCRQILERKGIFIGSHIYSVGGIRDEAFYPTDISRETLDKLFACNFPVLSGDAALKMQSAILVAKEQKDSVGGVIETAAIGLPSGYGSPFFEGVESRVAAMVFSIPAVKGVEFGAGFGISELRGSEANDAFYMDGDTVKTRTNHAGGLNGGITNGMPLIVRAAFRPTPSIAKQQDTVDLLRKENAKLEIHGRHDPCIVLRAVPVMDAAICVVLTDLLRTEGEKFD